MAKVLKGIRSRYGTYGVYGNHDVSEKLVGGFTTQTDANPTRDPRIDRMMAKAGITMLQDQVISVDGKIELVGRLDGEKTGYRNNRRESLQNLMQTVDKNKPVLVLNHEPEHLKDYKDTGVDLLMAGHTHAGQFFPLTIMRSFVGEN